MVGKKIAYVLLPLIWHCLLTGALQAAVITRLAEGEMLNISVLGTSVSATGSSFWAKGMRDWLNSTYPGKVVLNNEAVSGAASQTTATTFANVNGLDSADHTPGQLELALTNNPDVVFIEFAINDAVSRFNITPEMSKANLKTMIGVINSWGAAKGKPVDVVLMTMNNAPLSTGESSRPNLATFYQNYRDVAKEYGLLLIDNEPIWSDQYREDPDVWKSYMTDGILHPNQFGTDEIILPNIQRALLAQAAPEPCAAITAVSGGCVAVLYVLGHRKRRLANMPRRRNNQHAAGNAYVDN